MRKSRCIPFLLNSNICTCIFSSAVDKVSGAYPMLSCVVVACHFLSNRIASLSFYPNFLLFGRVCAKQHWPKPVDQNFDFFTSFFKIKTCQNGICVSFWPFLKTTFRSMYGPHCSNTGLSSTQYEQIPVILRESEYWILIYVFFFDLHAFSNWLWCVPLTLNCLGDISFSLDINSSHLFESRSRMGLNISIISY